MNTSIVAATAADDVGSRVMKLKAFSSCDLLKNFVDDSCKDGTYCTCSSSLQIAVLLIGSASSSRQE